MTSAEVLLRALREFLGESVQAGLSGYAAYQARIASNLVAMLEREARHGDTLAQVDAEALGALGMDERAGQGGLARAVRDKQPLHQETLREYLLVRTLLRLAIDNPRYSGLLQAQARWPSVAAEVDALLTPTT